MTVWLAILGTAAGCYALKLLGLAASPRLLEDERVRTVAALAPIALLAGLTALQTLGTSSGGLQLDARAAGLAVAATALLLRAPFLVVVAGAVAATALVRALTG